MVVLLPVELVPQTQIIFSAIAARVPIPYGISRTLQPLSASGIVVDTDGERLLPLQHIIFREAPPLPPAPAPPDLLHRPVVVPVPRRHRLREREREGVGVVGAVAQPRLHLVLGFEQQP